MSLMKLKDRPILEKEIREVKNYNKKYQQKHKKEIYMLKRNVERIKYNESQREWTRQHSKERCAHANKYRLKRKYNLSFEQLDEILVNQNHKCALCGKLLIETKRCIDHDHKVGLVRGVLCKRCNTGLTYVEDIEFLQKATIYLKPKGD